MSISEFGSSEAASLGGKARAEGMTEMERAESARRAAEARWAKAGKTPAVQRATHAGTLKIGDIELACAVLEDGTRVISERGLLAGMGITFGGQLARGADKLPLFVASKNLRPFIDNDLTVLLQSPIEYRPLHGGKAAHGLRAELIPKVCGVWLSARDAGALQERQLRVATKADILIRGLAEVGVVALVDEATGYQDARARDALAKILEAFVQKELRKWVKTFPPEFYKEMFRLRSLPYTGTVKSPRYIGHLTNDIVYSRLAPGVLDELKRVTPRNESGKPKHKLHQHLTNDVGHPKLLQHLASVTTLMRASDKWDQFKRLLDRALPVHVPAPLFDGMEDNYGDEKRPRRR